MLNYYEGQDPLSDMHPKLLTTLDDWVRQLEVNWLRLVVDALEEHIDLTSGGISLRTVETDFGRLNIMMSRHMPADT